MSYRGYEESAKANSAQLDAFSKTKAAADSGGDAVQIGTAGGTAACAPILAVASPLCGAAVGAFIAANQKYGAHGGPGAGTLDVPMLCSGRGGTKSLKFVSEEDFSYQCNDGSACLKKPGKTVACKGPGSAGSPPPPPPPPPSTSYYYSATFSPKTQPTFLQSASSAMTQREADIVSGRDDSRKKVLAAAGAVAVISIAFAAYKRWKK